MTPQEQRPPAARSPEFGYEWVTRGDVRGFVRRMQAIREGEEPATPWSEQAQPATAIRALYAFALTRSVADLIESATHFRNRDAVNVLAIAALCRSVSEAAELAIGQWDAVPAAEARLGGPAGAAGLDDPEVARLRALRDGIVHDVACQRTTLDVAAFIRECRGHGRAELAERTVQVFARTSSGRTNLDKALLYLALRDEGCEQEADELLRRTLDAIGRAGGTERDPDTSPVELHDLVGALHHLSPSERILEKWIDAELKLPTTRKAAIQLAAVLLADRPGGPDTLVEHVGRHWSRDNLIRLCEQLARQSCGRYEDVGRHVAARTDLQDLADLVRAWDGSKVLGRSTETLLAQIVARGAESAQGPRSLAELDDLAAWLDDSEASARCGRLLRRAAAEHVDGRSGQELAVLLGRVDRRPDHERAAQRIAQRLAARVIATGTGNEVFVDYLKALRAARDTEAVYAARRELADPSGSAEQLRHWRAVVADIADRLYSQGLQDDGWDLLERYLENEQRITTQDVVEVVAGLQGSAMPEERRYLLLRATVGRWSDGPRREEVVTVLRRRGFEAAASAVIRSLR
ncbi:hypothetical protein [Kitasatospora viridis]|uniref:Uncharacterized protein n=1 Tax=Kitasatospora viridis TaxID=281105 RepID=A0A561SFH3_9ACTN|nr:hypothetical protein [Kitasatospora viridis]TWF73623.1 hypothetical protein FHX73_15236 [Kitasatospora viridis]